MSKQIDTYKKLLGLLPAGEVDKRKAALSKVTELTKELLKLKKSRATAAGVGGGVGGGGGGGVGVGVGVGGGEIEYKNDVLLDTAGAEPIEEQDE